MTADGTIWDVLGLSPTDDPAAIRRAYASQLRTTRPEEDSAGFMRLRAAYDAALAQASRPAEPPKQAPVLIRWQARKEARRQAPAPLQVRLGTGPAPRILTRENVAGPNADTPGDPAPEVPAVEQAAHASRALSAALEALRSALQADPPPPQAEPLALLRLVLDLAKRAPVMSQSDALSDLAQMLVANTPRSDPLFGECMDLLGWHGRESELASDPLMQALQDARLLVPLRSGQHRLSKAFQYLSGPQNVRRRWWRAHVAQRGSWPEELQLLALLDRTRPHLLAALHQPEVQWWQRFAAGPVLSPFLLGVGYKVVLPVTVFMLLVAIGVSIAVHAIAYLALALVLLVAPAYIALMLGKLYLIDWPPYVVARRWPRLPLALTVGWLPWLSATCAAALLPRTPLLPAWATALLGAAGCLWAHYVSTPAPVLTDSRVLQALALNAALALWGRGVAAELGASHVPPDAFAAVAWLSWSAGLGLHSLRAGWSRIAQGTAQMPQLLLAACGIGVAGVLTTASSPAWQPVNVWLVVSFVAAHRAALDYNWPSIRARLIVLAACLCLATLVLRVTDIPLSAPITRAGGLVLVVAALCNLWMARGNPWRARGRCAQADS